LHLLRLFRQVVVYELPLESHGSVVRTPLVIHLPHCSVKAVGQLGAIRQSEHSLGCARVFAPTSQRCVGHDRAIGQIDSSCPGRVESSRTLSPLFLLVTGKIFYLLHVAVFYSSVSGDCLCLILVDGAIGGYGSVDLRPLSSISLNYRMGCYRSSRGQNSDE